MRVLLQSTPVNRDLLSEEALVEFLSLCPEQIASSFVMIRVDERKAEACRRAVSILEEAGVKRAPQFGPRVKDAPSYYLNRRREYTDAELSAFSLVELLRVNKKCEGFCRDEEGRIKLPRAVVRRLVKRPEEKIEVIQAWEFGHWFIVSPAFASRTQQADLKRLLLRDTTVVNFIGAAEQERRVYSWSSFGSMWPEMTSELILPNLAPSVVLVNQHGEPVEDEPREGYRQAESDFDDPELRYTRGALIRAGEFDIAMTRERFGFDPYDRRLVCSQRLRQFLIQHGVKADWRPVRIEED